MAIEFAAASSEYINIGTAVSIDNIWDGGGSLAFWLKLTSLPGDGAQFRLCGKDAGGGNGWNPTVRDAAGAGALDNVLRFVHTFSTSLGVWDGPDEAFTSKTGIWVHIVIVYNADATANNPVFYIDGTSVTVTRTTGPVGTRTSGAGVALTIGQAFATEYLNGQFEDFRAYNRVLTAEEATMLAAGYRGPLGAEKLWLSMIDAQVVQHWDGDSLATTDVIPDMSGNGNDGTPTNTPTARASEAPRFGAMLG
jgi:hypothetical protein